MSLSFFSLASIVMVVAHAIPAQQAVPELKSIPEIQVNTTVGHLPRLPSLVAGVYEERHAGPLLRVNWPAPTDNSQVLEAGSYTLAGQVPGTSLQAKATVTVSATPAGNAQKQRTLEPFPLGQVTLHNDRAGRPTAFIKNRDKFIQALAKTDPDRFLYNFRDAFGQQQPAGVKPLGVWDSQETRLRGHGSGHYLSAIAQAYASTSYDEGLRKVFLVKMDQMIDTLHRLSQLSGRPLEVGGQHNADPATVPMGPGKEKYDSDLSKDGIRTDFQNWGAGFISGYPPDQFIMLEHGASYGGSNANIWAPYYTLHKIIAGLLDCYEIGGNQKALEVAEGMGSWVHKRLELVQISTRIKMWNTYIAGEYGGMNEVMARLHTLTGKARYLECAQLFDNISFFFGDPEHSHGLAKNVDTLRSKHANQHIPQITGALETYKGTRNPEYYCVADNFWHISTEGYMYSIGGVAGGSANSECFTAEPNSLFAGGFNKGGQNETCGTYNLLKLSRELFMFDADGKYMDYYERALYNQILASVAENSPANTYHISLKPGAQKHFGNPKMEGFTCCNGTALESSTKLQDSIYFKSTDGSSLFVNLYVPSSVTWKEQGVVLTQSTSFPYEDTTRLSIDGEGAFTLQLRVPHWASRGFSVKINGKQHDCDPQPGSYLALRRTWKKNDRVEIKMPFHFYLSPIMDQPNIASLFYGPVLLAAEESEELSTWRAVTLDAQDIGKSISGDPAALRFESKGVKWIPFFEMYGRHSVYLDVTLK